MAEAVAEAVAEAEVEAEAVAAVRSLPNVGRSASPPSAATPVPQGAAASMASGKERRCVGSRGASDRRHHKF